MSASGGRFGSSVAVLLVLALVTGCAFADSSSSPPSPCTATVAPATSRPTSDGSDESDLVVLGRIVTMDEPALAEGLLIRGGRVTCVGTRAEVLALAGDEVRVVDIGANVAYPGFVDAHAHWIGNRELAELGSADEAMDAAIRPIAARRSWRRDVSSRLRTWVRS